MSTGSVGKIELFFCSFSDGFCSSFSSFFSALLWYYYMYHITSTDYSNCCTGVVILL